jgi:UDP-3-O-[3-hydroxymyristoyl] glucosamine N-acyltransferase
MVISSVGIDPTAPLGEHVALGENIRIEADVWIGNGCIIDDNAYIGKNTIHR